MGTDGAPALPFSGSVFEFSKVVASFDTKEEADSFALAHGWQTVDKDGMNHRCPNCVQLEAGRNSTTKRGAYISTADWRTP